MTKTNHSTQRERLASYWRANLKLVSILLLIWFAVSFGASILFVDVLDRFSIGSFKLGFWFAQQGSIFTFVLLIFIYVFLMNRLDRKYGVSSDAPDESRSP